MLVGPDLGLPLRLKCHYELYRMVGVRIIQEKNTNSHIRRAVVRNLVHNGRSMYPRLGARPPIHME